MNTRHALVGDGSGYANATISASVEDLHAVVTWARRQEWFVEPLLLAGHSLGGICVLEEAHRHGAHLLIPVSPVVSAELLLAAYGDAVLEWRTTRWQEKKSSSKPGVVKRLDWHRFDRDLLNYDALSYARTLTLPTLLIVGSDDTSTPPSAVRALADELPDVTMHVIDGAPHTFRDARHLEELHEAIVVWLNTRVH
jgi:pimeloyl-ACP methyl ester carboxylesterase